MKVVRVFTGEDSQSHFEDIEIPLAQSSGIGSLSRLYKGPGVIFRQVDGTYDLDFHNAPRRQLVVNLQGSVEIEVGSGEKRQLHTGDILVAEDTTGQGHRSRAIDGQSRDCLFIPIDDHEKFP